MYFVVAFSLLLHALFWGAGFAWALTPRRWRQFWPVFAPAVGLTLQSVVVWAGAYAGLAGTNTYARYAEALPALLLALAVWRRRGALWTDVRRLGVLWFAMAACLAVLVWPLSRAAKDLTTVSLGSCDAADYAAGARVLQEFARSDRAGFIGQTEVVAIGSVDNFYDYWLRLNHFTPSALIAFNGAVFGRVPHEITGLMTASLLALSLPLVFWMARAVLGYRRWWAVGIAALYGLNPLTWYAVYQVAPGQLLAAQAIAVITWAGVALWHHGAVNWRRGWTFAGLLVVAYGLVLGSYNFIVLVCLVPTLTYVGGRAWWTGRWPALGRWAVLMLAPLAVAGGIFAERVAGLAERFRLFKQYDFGWRMPLLTPEGWLGMVADAKLQAWCGSGRIVLSGAAVLLLGWALARAAKARQRRVYLALSLALPALVGYGYLQLRGFRLDTNASYDAYKLLSVFFPEVLAGLCFWATFDRGAWTLRWLAAGFGLALVALNGAADRRFYESLRTPHIVDRELQDLQKIERMPQIASLNMQIPNFWSRLWANAFLLRKPQYFSTHTYEGRLNTRLAGAWDLNGSLLRVIPPDARDTVVLSPAYALLDTHSRYFLRARLSEGWYDAESLPDATMRWHWTKGDAEIEIENPHPYPLRVVCRFDVRSLVERDLQIWVNDRLVHTVLLSPMRRTIRIPEITIPRGGADLRLRSSVPPTSPGAGDTRLLGFVAYGIDLEIQPLSPPRTP